MCHRAFNDYGIREEESTARRMTCMMRNPSIPNDSNDSDQLISIPLEFESSFSDGLAPFDLDNDCFRLHLIARSDNFSRMLCIGTENRTLWGNAMWSRVDSTSTHRHSLRAGASVLVVEDAC